jgi:AbrB family looped-hinge helix DNA binding protein
VRLACCSLQTYTAGKMPACPTGKMPVLPSLRHGQYLRPALSQASEFQIVIPEEIRRRHQLEPGQKLMVIDHPDHIEICPGPRRTRRSGYSRISGRSPSREKIASSNKGRSVRRLSSLG